MKTKLTLVFIAIFAMASENYGQFAFGVSPGIGLNSTYFGYKKNDKTILFIGFQYLNAKYKYKESGQEFDYDLGRVINYTDREEFSGNLYIPNIGVKYFLKKQNKIQSYLSLCISKPFLSGKLKIDGEIDEDFKKEIKSISMFGGEFGFGAEYFFDENFSIGGEFGLRYLHLKYNNTYDRDFYNPVTGNYQATKIENDYRFNMSPTYSKIALNFYF